MWTAESAVERDRLLRLPAAARLAALDDDAVRTLLTAEHRAEVRASLAPGNDNHTREQTVTAWTEDRRRMALMFTLRPIAAAGCVVAALAPFVVAAWRWGWGPWEGVERFLSPGWPLAGAVVAGLAGGLLARVVQRATTTDGLAWPVLVSAVVGMLGVALAVL